MMKIKSLFRRGGQGQTASSKNLVGSHPHGGNGIPLKEASSISSLDSKHKISPIYSSKLTKVSSKEKLDNNKFPPTAALQKNDRSKSNEINRNTTTPGNNNTAPVPPPISSADLDALKNNNKIEFKDSSPALNGVKTRNTNQPISLPETFQYIEGEIAMQDLASVQEQLEMMARENAVYQEEIKLLVDEKLKLQNQIQLDQIQHASEIEQLTEEVSALRNRLRDVAHSPLSDNEKQQLLLEPTGTSSLMQHNHNRQHNSAPASFSAPSETMESGSNSNPISAGDCGAPSSCPTPDWDKHSSSSMSEVSVACLQDRILQMEETHYSTNEELQATLQELADLQTQLLELQSENERLADEKSVLLESLCQQTEKLEDCRSTIDTLQELLVRGDGQEQKESVTGSDREQKLVELLKNAQEEREALMLKHSEMTAELNDLRQSTALQIEERERLIDRVRLLESTVDSVHAERKLIDQELAQAKEQGSARRIEISRLTTLLENARAQIDELEKERDNGDRSEMDALLDTARKEKDSLESHVATLQGQVSRGQCEKERLQEQLSLLQEECKVAKNNAKSMISDLEYQLFEVKREMTTIRAELQTSQDAVVEAQTQAQRHLEDKRNLKAILAESQRQLNEVQERLSETEEKLSDEQRLRKEENNEWEQFQRDLLMTVRVANDFKTEAQSELEKLVHENKALRDKVRGLEAQIEKLKEKLSLSEQDNILVDKLDEKKKLYRDTDKNEFKSTKIVASILKNGNADNIDNKNLNHDIFSKYIRHKSVPITNLRRGRTLYKGNYLFSKNSKLSNKYKSWSVNDLVNKTKYKKHKIVSPLEKLDELADDDCTISKYSLYIPYYKNPSIFKSVSLPEITSSSFIKQNVLNDEMGCMQIYSINSVKPQTPPLLRQSSVPVETQQSLFTSVQQEMAARRQKAVAARQDSRLSVKSLIESIENATKQVKAGPDGSRSSSTSSLNSCVSDNRPTSLTPPGAPPNSISSTNISGANDWNDDVFVKSPLREQQQVITPTINKPSRQTNGKNLITDVTYGAKCDVGKSEDTIRESVALLSAKNIDFVRRNSYGDLSERKDPLYGLVKNGGSKRNALLKWCQQKTVGYRNIDITNFSSSWNDGLALCAILHTYLPDRVPYDTLVPTEKRRNFSLAFSAAESVGIPTTLNINDMCQLERPDWQQVMAYVTAIYKHFET